MLFFLQELTLSPLSCIHKLPITGKGLWQMNLECVCVCTWVCWGKQSETRFLYGSEGEAVAEKSLYSTPNRTLDPLLFLSILGVTGSRGRVDCYHLKFITFALVATALLGWTSRRSQVLHKALEVHSLTSSPPKLCRMEVITALKGREPKVWKCAQGRAAMKWRSWGSESGQKPSPVVGIPQKPTVGHHQACSLPGSKNKCQSQPGVPISLFLTWCAFMAGRASMSVAAVACLVINIWCKNLFRVTDDDSWAAALSLSQRVTNLGLTLSKLYTVFSTPKPSVFFSLPFILLRISPCVQ